jgi:hypothetical protein
MNKENKEILHSEPGFLVVELESTLYITASTGDKTHTWRYIKKEMKTNIMENLEAYRDLLQTLVESYNNDTEDIILIKGISKNHFDYLTETFNIVPVPGGDDYEYQYNFYYNHAEGHITAYGKSVLDHTGAEIDKYTFYDLILFTNNGGVERKFFNEVIKGNIPYTKGLARFIDHNYGGTFSKETLQIISEIIFG